MRLLSKGQVEVVTQRSIAATEYEFGDPDINLARVELSGRYPIQGFAVNREAKMCCYVERGSGTLCVEESLFALKAGDACIIEPGERYYWEMDAGLLISSTPPWTADQADTA